MSDPNIVELLIYSVLIFSCGCVQRFNILRDGSLGDRPMVFFTASGRFWVSLYRALCIIALLSVFAHFWAVFGLLAAVVMFVIGWIIALFIGRGFFLFIQKVLHGDWSNCITLGFLTSFALVPACTISLWLLA